jgi:dolichyl-phosphate-mannose-protein mannosyltransferase
MAAYDRGVTSLSTTDAEADLASAGREPATPSARPVPEIVRRRLAPEMPKDGLFSWIGTFVVVAIAGVLRFVNLSKPPGKIFDEIYYATEGHDLITHGVEWNATNNTGDFVVHPPLGKWLIGVGEWLFKYNEFGWRFMPAVFGTLAVLILIRVTRRLFRSTVLGLFAGLLMALDGMELVLSRTALLDIFLMFFILAAFACLVMDRDARRRRWLRAMDNGLDPSDPTRAGRPKTSWRRSIPWWRLAAAVMTGCAMSVKWSALWYIVLFFVLIIIWEIGTRRSAGVEHPVRDALLDEAGWVILFGVVIGAVYLASWTGWFVTDTGWGRTVAPGTNPVWGALDNLYKYHRQALHFHDTLTAHHDYQSWPWQWLLLGRPVAFYYSSAPGCSQAPCSAEVLLLGTPLLWWSFLPALVGTAAFGIARRDWRALAIFLGAVVGIVPWFRYELLHRTMFYFYAAPAVPFLILCVVYLFGAIMRAPATNPGRASLALAPPPGASLWTQIKHGYHRDPRLFYGAVAMGVYMLVIGWCFAYFWPIYTGEKITYASWFAHMWLGGRWI